MVLGSSLQCFLICVLCSLCSPHIGVNAQPRLGLLFDPPPIIINEGDNVTLHCIASNIQAGYYIEWVRKDPSGDVILASNGTSLNSRISMELASTSDSRSERITVSNIGKMEDSFGCRVKDRDGNYLANRSASFYVRFFPDEKYPVCTPAGEFTVQSGTTQTISCTTERSNPLAQMAITTTGGADVVSDWTFTEDAVTFEGHYSKEQTWTVTVNFTCTLSSSAFPNKESSCYIGPVTVVPETSPETTPEAAATPTTPSSAPDMISKFRPLALLVTSFSLIMGLFN